MDTITCHPITCHPITRHPITKDVLYMDILSIAFNKKNNKCLKQNYKKVPVIEKFIKDKLNGYHIGMFMWEYRTYGSKYVMSKYKLSEEVVESFGTFAGLY